MFDIKHTFDSDFNLANFSTLAKLHVVITNNILREYSVEVSLATPGQSIKLNTNCQALISHSYGT